MTLHHLTRTTSSTVQPTRRTSTSTFQECRIWQWNDHTASTFTTWFRRSRTTLSDKHFKVIFNNSHRLWAQCSWRLRPLRDFCNDLPGWIRRLKDGALVLVRRGTRRWDRRQRKNWSFVKAQHSIQFQEKDWSKIETLSLNSFSRCRTCSMKSIVWTIRVFLRCWFSTQWIFPRCQSTCVFSTSSNAWRNVETFFRIDELQRRAAKHAGHTWYIGKSLCKSSCVLFSALFGGIESMEFRNRRAASLIHSRKKWETNTRSRPEMPVWTVSQKFSHLQWRRLFKESWSRPTTADFGYSFRQIPYTNLVCLLEDKIADWGMYLLTPSYGSNAMDQRSGGGWISGWFKIFVINKRYFNAKFWSTRCEDCFSTEQNHP